MKASGKGLGVIGLATLAATASANAAMGLAYENFDYTFFAAYVAVMILLETWLIGRALEFNWFVSAFVSIIANALSAFMCGGGFFAPLLHLGAYPNPILHTVMILSIGGLFSIAVEAPVWWMFLGGNRTDKPLGKQLFISHLVGIPLALCILLIPERPYVGMEAQAHAFRFINLRHNIKNAYEDRRTPEGEYRQFQTVEELMKAYVAANSDRPKAELDFFVPEFGRFDTGKGQGRMWNIEMNPSPSEESDWLVKVRRPDSGRGFVLLRYLQTDNLRGDH